MILRTSRIALALLMLVAIVQPAATQQPLTGGTVIEAVERLKPGEFLWAPELAPDGPALLIVSVTSQRAILYRNGVPIAISTVSTGRKGHRTPTGVFTVLEKQVEHYSSLYDDAPMPFMQRLTWRGVALHGGNLPGYPASHGCIRLPHRFAELLYGVTRLGMTVIVTDAAQMPRLAPFDGSIASGPAAAPESTDTTEWHPERAPSGPVSIVISAADRRIVVLRNGREIGSAPVTIAGSVTTTTAYVLREADPAGAHWLTVPLSGEPVAEPVAADFWQRFAVDSGFRAAVAQVVAPGTTVLLTADTLVAGSAGQQRTVIEAEPEGKR